MSTRSLLAGLSCTLALLSLSGCNTGTAPPSTEVATAGGTPDLTPSTNGSGVKSPYTIVTTCGMVTDIVSVVAGDRATVNGLMGENVDPHMYKPTRNDQKTLLGADVIFYSGLMLEGRMSDTFIGVGRSGKPVYAVTEKISEDYLRQPPEFEGHWDPHVWMDITAWSQCVDVIATALSGYDSSDTAGYRKRANDYQAQLREMDEYIHRTISTIPENQRWLITAHDAFGYFSRAYKIPVKSAQGISTDSDAAVDDINQLVAFIVEKKIAAIFAEASVNKKNILAIIEGCKQKRWEVRIGGKLYSDAMGAPGTYTGTYLGMMDHNATTITRALGGEAPAAGKNGKLVPPSAAK